jgi:hypothetical protein
MTSGASKKGKPMSKKEYEDRTDLEKIQSQWNKLTGLHSREEFSGAVVRAATAAEIAANFAVRQEFESQSKCTEGFVNNLLRWANGIEGKLNRLLIPMTEGSKRHKTLTEVKKSVERINKKRNAVAHQGEFCNIDESKEVIDDARHFIETVVKLYDPGFKLKDKKKRKK